MRLVFSAIFFVGVFVVSNVYADNYGDGNGTSGVNTNCGIFIYGYQYLCGNPAGSGGGGASWHIYSTSTYSGPRKDTTNIIKGNIDIINIKSACPSSTYDWYVAYGWEGSSAKGHYNELTGPAQRSQYVSGVYNTIYGASYNNYGALSYDTVINKLKNNENINNQRIQSSAATQMYQRMTGSSSIPSNIGYFCANLLFRLDAYAAVSGTYNSATGYKELISTQPFTTINNIDKGSSRTVNAPDFKNYTYNEWGESCKNNGVDGRSGRNCTKTNISSNVEIYAYYIKNKFSGSSTVKQDNKSTNKADDGAITISCGTSCPSVTFTFNLEQEEGNKGRGGTSYQIYRNDSLNKGWTAVDPGSSGLAVPNSSGYTETGMKAGDQVCYKIVYYSVPADGRTESKVSCAIAEGNGYTPTKETKGSNIKLQIRDQDSGASYRNFDDNRNFVYAKPGDDVELKGTFTPSNQSMYNYKPNILTLNNIPGRKLVPNTTVSLPLFGVYKTVHGAMFGLAVPWNNAFSVLVNNSCTWAYSGVTHFGVRGIPFEYDGTSIYSVKGTDVGGTKAARASTNECPLSLNTPKSATYKTDRLNNSTVTVDLSASSSKEMFIKVPYNFENSTFLENVSDELVIGQPKTIRFGFKVGTKQNNETNGKYATKVDDAKYQLCYRYRKETDEKVGSDVCEEDAKNIGAIEVSNYSAGKTVELKGSITVGAFPSGANKVCVVSKIYPKYSGGDDNLSTDNFYGWDESAEKCFEVSKKPTFQVWGSSIYTTGNWGTEIADKEGRTFGSWVELGLISEGTVTGFSSGASTGYKTVNDASSVNSSINNPNSVAISDLGGSGSDESSYCKRSLLSFANSECNSGGNSVGGISGVSDVLKNDKEILLSKLNSTSDDSLLSSGSDSFDGKIFIKREGDITISENIQYKDGPYNSVNDIPKVIIYATENITIDCGVHRVDAILIADGDVITCESDNYDSSDNSNQLKINGAIIAKNIKLNRTYGAASGNNSIIPAEIINYDSSLYLWAYANSEGTSGVTQMKEVYSKDLPPRY